MVARISQDLTISPNLLAHVTLGYNRDNFTYFAAGSAPTSTPVTLGIGNIVPVTPGFSFSGYAGMSLGGQTVIENGTVLNGFLSWIKGKHQIKIGADLVRQGDNTLNYSTASANFSYQETDMPSASNPAATGNGFASFLIGAVDSAGESYTPAEYGTRFQQLGAYFQDTYKTTSNLTLNLGIRYDIPWSRSQVHNVFSSFSPSLPNPGAGGLLGALAFAGNGSSPYCNCTRFSDTRFIYWQPRIGFAYKVNPKTVLRGGFGYFTGSSGDVLENGQRTPFGDGFNASPTWATTNLGVTPAFYLQNGFPSFKYPPFIDPTYDNNASINWDQKQDGTTAFVADWTLDLQRELPAGFMLDVGYVGNSGHHLGSNLLNVNQVNPTYLSLGNALTVPLSSQLGQSTGVPLPYAGFTGTVAQALRRYPQYQSISQPMQTAGSSHYNSLQVKLQRQFVHGLSVLASYTYAKLMTNADSQEGWYTPGGGSQNAFNLGQEMTVATIVPPQVLTFTYVYELPVGKGKRFVNNSRVADSIIGGWAVSGIQRYQSGIPLQVNNLYPNIVTGQSLRASWSGRFDPSKDVYLNAAAFSVPAPSTFGDASRTLPVRGFSYFNEDISLQKRFRINESMGFEIGADAFNIFNRCTFGGPDTGNPTTNLNFGVIGSQINAPRSVQIRARLTF
jgi:hypothetical protein